MSFLPYWMQGFDSDCFGDTLATSNDIEKYIYRTSVNRLYILEDNGMPVTMVKISRDLQTVCVVGLVYTPPYFRGKGYATSCVAAVSKIGLNRGFSKCVLYTNLANSTSNSIYMKIGYKPICDSIEIKFNEWFIRRYNARQKAILKFRPLLWTLWAPGALSPDISERRKS